MSSRKKDKGLVYLRRSTDSQENSLKMQIEWAIRRAGELGVNIEASLDDLHTMQSQRLHSLKSIRLDDAISGTEMKRPGFTSLQNDAKSDTSISHVFVQKRDRLGRPEEPMELALLEKSIGRSGVHIVFDDKIIDPSELGSSDLGADLSMLVDYHASRSWLNRNTERIVDSKVMLAKQGKWTGGRAPYGFKRVLVGPDGAIIEELKDGREVRQRGCHVELAHGDENELDVVRRTLDLKHEGLSDMKIAKNLNEDGIPSPNFGRTRIDQGVEHTVTGKWNSNAIKRICENKMMIGFLQTGRRSGGKIRRMSADGHRKLNDGDRNSEGEPITKVLDDSQTIIAKTRNEPQYDTEKWNDIQAILKERGKSQRGIPKSTDSGKYPLACRVFDQSCECGSVMYGKSNGKVPSYTCGRYMRTSGGECENNHVDGESLFRLTLSVLHQIVEDKFGRAALVKRLEAIAAKEKQTLKADENQTNLKKLNQQCEKLTKSVAVASRHMAEESDDELYKELAMQVKQLKAELKCVDERTAAMQETVNRRVDQPNDVDRAVMLFDNLEQYANAPDLRKSFSSLAYKSGLHIGLSFTSAVKGKKRVVRKLAAGIITFSEEHLPVPIHGKDRISTNKI